MDRRAMSLRNSVIAALREAADRWRSAAAKSYMKSDMPYCGSGAPQAGVSRGRVQAHPPARAGAWEGAISTCAQAPSARTYARRSLLLFARYSAGWIRRRLPAIEEMVVGAWWGHVEGDAGRGMGPCSPPILTP